MKREYTLKRFFIISMFIALTAATAFAQTTAFNFQGRLKDGANPANGNYEMQFKLYDALVGGTQIGATLARPNVVIINGIFTAQLDFGASVFDGSARFVEIGVRPAGNTNPYNVLSPRQPILATPYAIQAKNSAQLGGIDASQYVTTTTVGNSFIKNGTTQQTGNFNISGDGIAGNSFGIGVVPSDGYKLDVNGNQRLTIAAGRTITFASPNGETGMSTIVGNGRADLRFDGTTLKLVAGTVGSVPPSTNGIVINTSGDVGIGTLTPTSKLSVFNGNSGVTAIFGESQLNRGVWGKSFSSRGVYGESNSSQGVFGISVSGAGVMGTSTSSSGVYGETSIASPTASGVYGKGLVNDSLGVIGESNLGTVPVGVYGITSNPKGFGVFARNTALGGRALYADGNVAQSLSGGGMVKAMIYVNQDGTVNRCYNSQTNSSTGNCGFTIAIAAAGYYDINFGFPIDNRYIAAQALNNFGGSGCLGGGVSIDAPVGNAVRVNTFCTSFVNKPFMIFIY
jgi:hypothetical protein